MGIVLTPPPSQAFWKGTRVTLQSEADAQKLEAEGWLREPKKMADAPIFAKVQRKAGLDQLAKHSPELAKKWGELFGLLESILENNERVRKKQFGQTWVLVGNGAMHRDVSGLDLTDTVYR